VEKLVEKGIAFPVLNGLNQILLSECDCHPRLHVCGASGPTGPLRPGRCPPWGLTRRAAGPSEIQRIDDQPRRNQCSSGHLIPPVKGGMPELHFSRFLETWKTLPDPWSGQPERRQPEPGRTTRSGRRDPP
jgi:hypothetical protein